jgi:hypothetical protein
MENRIYKYILKFEDEQYLKLPKLAEVLTVQMQNDELALWAIVNPTQSEFDLRIFEIYGTGNPFPSVGMSERKYISTVQNNKFIWHIFEAV